MDEQYLSIDLHVHTPASKDWRGSKEESEYTNILQRAKSNNINLIAIADHNTVEGYKRIIKRKNDTEQLMSLMKKRTGINSEAVKAIEKESRLFESVRLLMAIELKAYPGIHYTIVFKENVDPDDVSNFLEEITDGKIKDNYGLEGFILDQKSTDLFKLINDRFKSDCFIYAPHADSSSGLIREVKAFGQERLNILGDDRLLCLGINKIGTKEYVKSQLLPNITAPRANLLQFIQDSDYHGGDGEEVGSGYFLLKKPERELNYNYIFSRLKKKKEVKSFLDVSKERYEEYIKDEHIIKLNISLQDQSEKEDFVDKLCKNVCAIFNSEKGIIQFEINTQGVDDHIKAIENEIDKIVEILKDKIGYSPRKGSFVRFPVTKNNENVLFKFSKSDRLVMYNNICYIFDINNKLSKANSNQIEAIVASKIYRRFGKRKDRAVHAIADEAYKIKNSLKCFSIAYRNDEYLTPFEEYTIDLLPLAKPNRDMIETINDSFLGSHVGNYIIIPTDKYKEIAGGRYESHYLRITAPLYQIGDFEEELKTTKITKGSILILIHGGVFWATTDSLIVTEKPCFVIKPSTDSVDFMSLAGYCRSTYWQWYLSKVLHNKDFFDFMLKKRTKAIPIPENLTKNATTIANTMHNVILEEANFLKEAKKHKKDNNKINHLVTKHNKKSDSYMLQIDKEIFNMFHLTKSEIKEMYQDLKEMNIYDYGALEKFNDIFD